MKEVFKVGDTVICTDIYLGTRLMPKALKPGQHYTVIHIDNTVGNGNEIWYQVIPCDPIDRIHYHPDLFMSLEQYAKLNKIDKKDAKDFAQIVNI